MSRTSHHIDPGTAFGARMTIGNPRIVVHKNGQHYARVWCICQCGEFHDVAVSNIIARTAGNCKRLRTGRLRASYRHGFGGGPKRTKEWRTWVKMRRRILGECAHPETYAGMPCDFSARDSFPEFLAEVGLAPSPKHTLDRIDGTKGYVRGNLRWATMREQAVNTRATLRFPDGTSLADAWHKAGKPVSYWTARYRFLQGKTLAECLQCA